MKRVVINQDDFNIVINYLAKHTIKFVDAKDAVKVQEAIDRAVIMDIQTKDEV